MKIEICGIVIIVPVVNAKLLNDCHGTALKPLSLRYLQIYMQLTSLFCLIPKVDTLFFFFYKNVVFPTQAEYSYFSADFRLKIFLYYS